MLKLIYNIMVYEKQANIIFKILEMEYNPLKKIIANSRA